MSAPSGELLIQSPVRWDEACFALPAVRAFTRAGMKTGVLCMAEQQAFWASVPGLDVLPANARDAARSLAKALRGNWRSAVVWEDGVLADAIRRAELPRCMGPAAERWARWVSDPVDLTEKPKAHRVESYLAVASALGMDIRDPALFAPAAWPEAVEKQTLLLIPDSDFGPSHEWPLDRWHELAQRLAQSGHWFRVASISGGRMLGRDLARLLDKGEPLDLSVSAAALPVLAGFQSIIAADGSLPHLASHAGADCLVLFGPNDPQKRRPLGRRHRIARHHVECAPCRLQRCPMDHRCQNELTVEKVWGMWSKCDVVS